MAEIKPFKGLRYSQNKDLRLVTSPPYDIISVSEQEGFYKADPNNVIRLELGAIYKDDTADCNRYTRAAEYLDDWLLNGILKREREDAFYIYEQEFPLENGGTKILYGLICLARLEPFDKGIILPHEKTLSKAKEDRLNLARATGANFSQVYSLYADEEKTVPQILDSYRERKPDIEFTSFEGIVQRLWIITDAGINSKISAAFSDKKLFIADGHHRYETALKYKENFGGPDYVMMFLAEMDNPGLVVFPTHRVVHGLEDFDEKKLLDKAREYFDISPAAAGEAPPKGSFILIAKGGRHRLTLRDIRVMDGVFPDSSPAYRHLDVNVLHSLLLDKLLRIDLANLALQKNLLYTRDAAEAEAIVKNGSAQCAFLLGPTLIDEIKDISLANEKMPQKSTYFWPKLITGLVMNKSQ